MSGHSKWATTHRQKEVKDAKRGAAFTKLAANITVAVRQGGGIGDPTQNFRLRLAMDKARETNMPKENIQRAIDKGTGASGGVQLEEARFEGFLPGGAALLVEVLTDNKLRTAQQVRTTLEKAGGTMGSLGSVGYLFEQVGEVVVDLEQKSVDEAELAAIDSGAKEVEAEEGRMYVITAHDEVFTVKERLEKQGLRVESAQLVMKPTSFVEIESEEKRLSIDDIISKIEEIDEVINTWHNYA